MTTLNCFGQPIAQMNHSELRSALEQHEREGQIVNPVEWDRLRLSCYAAADVIDPQFGLIDSLRSSFGDAAVDAAKRFAAS